VAWQVKKRKPTQKGFGTIQGYEWGQHASLITRIPKVSDNTLLEYACLVLRSDNTGRRAMMYFKVRSKGPPTRPPNTFVALTTEIANIEIRSECWVCPKPPPGLMTGLPLSVLPLTFFNHITGPV